MEWHDVEVGDLIEYKTAGSKRIFGIYLGVGVKTVGLVNPHIIFRDDFDYVISYEMCLTSIVIHSSVKEAIE